MRVRGAAVLCAFGGGDESALRRSPGGGWRVRDKSDVVSDASIGPPLLADKLIALEIRVAKACARLDIGSRAAHLAFRLASSKLLSMANSISLFHALQTSRSSPPPAEAVRNAWEPGLRILEFARMARETRWLVSRLDHKTARAMS